MTWCGRLWRTASLGGWAFALVLLLQSVQPRFVTFMVLLSLSCRADASIASQLRIWDSEDV
jgi:hypothetical protein